MFQFPQQFLRSSGVHLHHQKEDSMQNRRVPKVPGPPAAGAALWGQAALQYLQGWRSSPALEDSGGPWSSLMVPIWAEDQGLLSQSGLICLFVCYSPSPLNVTRYKQSSEHRSKSRSCTHCAGVHNQWAKDLLSHLSVFILTIRVRQWWKADSLTPSFEFRYLRFIRQSGLVCTNIINCLCSLRPMISVCRLASLKI